METGLGPDDVDAWIILANPFMPHLERWLAEWNVAFRMRQASAGSPAAAANRASTSFCSMVRATDAAVLALAVQGGKTPHHR